MGWDKAFFTLRYDLPQFSFKAFIAAEEEAARHALHEAGHDWYGTRLGMERLSVNLVTQGTSSMEFRAEDQSTYDWCLVGVAGILAEAKGTRNYGDNKDSLDPNRFGPIAQKIVEEVSANRDNPNYAFPLPVPMGPSRVSRELVSCTVSDFVIPLGRNELDAGMLLAALKEVATTLNGEDGWASFQAHHTWFKDTYPAHPA